MDATAVSWRFKHSSKIEIEPMIEEELSVSIFSMSASIILKLTARSVRKWREN
jgi:hypothetical protein